MSAASVPTGDDPESAVAGTDLTVAYGSHIALSRATFRFPRGRRTAIIGPNGSGKSTLLAAISGLVAPSSGGLEVLGRPSTAGGRRVAHVLQSHTINEALPLTVAETVRMGRYAQRGLLGRLGPEDRDAIDAAIERMDVGDLLHRHLRELSGGQRQRVFVAQGLSQQADLLLLDEPVTGLDVRSQDRIDHAIAEELAAGRTVVLTTHDVATAAEADHVLLLATHVVADGTADEVLTEDHLAHAYGGTVFRTADGTLVIGDPHIHGTTLRGHEHH